MKLIIEPSAPLSEEEVSEIDDAIFELISTELVNSKGMPLIITSYPKDEE